MQPPAWFVRAIGILDPLLSVRRSEVSSHWVIERKAAVPASETATLIRREARIWRWINFPNEDQKKNLHKNRVAWQAIHDEVAAARAGKRVVCRPRTLTQQVYNDLCASDIRGYGGFARFCTDMEAEEERVEAEAERVTSNKRQAMNGEVYSILNFLDRKRFDAISNRPESELDLKYLLHGKHTQPGDGPLIQLTDF